MKITYQRRHVVRPENYEAVELLSRVEVDLDNEEDKADFGDLTTKKIGTVLSGMVDDLLDTDVDRTLRLDGEHINETHLWVFYGRD